MKEKSVGETKTAGFEIGVRKTFKAGVDTSWDLLFSTEGVNTWLGPLKSGSFEPGQPFETVEGIEGTLTVFKPMSHVRLTWKRKQWANASILQIRVIKANGKSTISFHQEKLTGTVQREEMREYWKRVIEKITERLE